MATRWDWDNDGVVAESQWLGKQMSQNFLDLDMWMTPCPQDTYLSFISVHIKYEFKNILNSKLYLFFQKL